MGQYRSFDPSAWERTLQTTVPKHLNEEVPAFMRAYKMGALIDGAGMVSYNNGGAGFEWDVQYKKHSMYGTLGDTERDFSPVNLHKKAELEYRGYEVTDAISKREILSNSGKQAYVRVYDRFVDRLKASIKQGLGPEYYVDGYASGNEQSWNGLESMFGLNGTINVSTGAQRTANAADPVGYASDTYANLSTELGNYGGSNESGVVWPEGLADSEYDFWTPLTVNYTSTYFDGASDTWDAQGDEALRFGITHASRNSSDDGEMTHIFVARDLWIGLTNLLDTKEEVQVTSENSLRAFGFKQVLTFDGIEVARENAIPTGVAYGFDFKCIDLRFMTPEMFDVDGPEYDIDSSQFKCAVRTLGNLRFKSPRSFCKWAALA